MTHIGSKTIISRQSHKINSKSYIPRHLTKCDFYHANKRDEHERHSQGTFNFYLGFRSIRLPCLFDPTKDNGLRKKILISANFRIALSQ